MRYIADSSGYVKQVSFGADISCDGVDCTEYNGSVPTGYTSLEAWYLAESEKLYRWKVVSGLLILDSEATPPAPDTPGGGGSGDCVAKAGDTMTGNLVINKREVGGSPAVYLQGKQGESLIQSGYYVSTSGEDVGVDRVQDGETTNYMRLYDDRVEFGKPIAGVHGKAVLLWEGSWTSGNLVVAKTGGSTGCTGLGDLNEWSDILIRTTKAQGAPGLDVHLPISEDDTGTEPVYGGTSVVGYAGTMYTIGFRANWYPATNTLSWSQFRWNTSSTQIPVVKIYGVRRWADVILP